jgi:hypothetical protein
MPFGNTPSRPTSRTQLLPPESPQDGAPPAWRDDGVSQLSMRDSLRDSLYAESEMDMSASFSPATIRSSQLYRDLYASSGDSPPQSPAASVSSVSRYIHTLFPPRRLSTRRSLPSERPTPFPASSCLPPLLLLLSLLSALLLGFYAGSSSLLASPPQVLSFTTSLPPSYRPHFIVVGAGPAGILLSLQLARSLPSSRVLLIEAGDKSQSGVPVDNDELVTGVTAFDVPLLWSLAAETEEYLWAHPANIRAGRAVGGSGIHNAMIAVRATDGDMRRWSKSDYALRPTPRTEQTPYLKGWDYEALRSVYNKLESRSPSPSSAPSAHRGVAGPLRVSPPGPLDKLSSSFLSSCSLSGRPSAGAGFPPDARLGCGAFERNVRGGRRESPAAVLGREHADLPNLAVLYGATALEVLFEGSDGDGRGEREAVAVRYEQVHEEASTKRRGSMMTYKTNMALTIMRVAGSATSAMRKPQTSKRVRNDEA